MALLVLHLNVSSSLHSHDATSFNWICDKLAAVPSWSDSPALPRLLDPHGLPYKWPFGGLSWLWSLAGSTRECPREGVLLEGGVLQGADWDREGGSLVVGQGGGRLPALRGVPGDQREMALAKVTDRAMVDTDKLTHVL